MLTFLESKDGKKTVKFNDQLIHSLYSPLKEAEKFFYNNSLNNYKTIVIIAPALNYIASVVRKKNINCKIISIYLFKDFFLMDNNKSDAKYLFSKDDKNIDLFFKKTIQELDLEGLKIIEWFPLKKLNQILLVL